MAANLKCIYGNTVKLLNLYTNETTDYDLVHYQSEKLDQNKISNYTSIGKAIWAKHEGTEVDVDFPNGAQRVRILSIENTK